MAERVWVDAVGYRTGFCTAIFRQTRQNFWLAAGPNRNSLQNPGNTEVTYENRGVVDPE